MFKKAERKKAKLRLAITGPSGSGKTYSALLLSKGLGGKVAVVDTENGSASMYSHLLDFDVAELTAPYTPERYIEMIQEAEKAGYDVLILDSITHEWSGVGGMLDINRKVADTKFKGNTWSAWSDCDPRHRRFIDAMLQSKMHIIATMRSKTETAQEDSNGRKRVVQLGMKAEQRDTIIYEFTVVLDLTHEQHYATATKDRTGIFSGQDIGAIAPYTGQHLLEWLDSGRDEAEIIKESAEAKDTYTHMLDGITDIVQLRAYMENTDSERKVRLTSTDYQEVRGFALNKYNELKNNGNSEPVQE